MARIRSIKPDFWTDEKIVGLSPFARLLFIGMWNFVDDEGRAPYSPGRLKMQIFPADNLDISELVGELRRSGRVEVYQVDGKDYFQVTHFTEHQKIDKRSNSKHPSPPNPPESPRALPLEGKGREGNGRDSAAPAGRVEISQPTAEADLFRRGKEILGKNSGGLIAEVLKSKGGNVALARSALETASTKGDAREYLGAIIRNRDAKAQGDAW